MKSAVHLILGLMLLGIAGASSCKPEPPVQKYLGTYPLGDIKDYLFFKPGSMWVYECDSTGELDTQVMVSLDTPWTIKPFIKYQLLTYSKKSLNEGSIYNSPFPGGDMYYNENYKYFYQSVVYRSNPKNGGTGSDAVFFKPFDTAIYGHLSSPTYYKGLLTNYSVLGNMYDTVRVYEVKAGGTYPECSIKSWNLHSGQLTYYWAKGVGLIRLHVWTRRPDQSTFKFNWNLKSYQLK